MKNFFTLLVFCIAVLSATAQGHGAMKFVGQSQGTEDLGSTLSGFGAKSDTIIYVGKSMTTADVTLPKMDAFMEEIPSFTIHNATFTMDMATMTATFGEQEFSATVVKDGQEKTVTGTMSAAYGHNPYNAFSFNANFTFNNRKYTYHILAFYVKEYTDRMSVVIGGEYPYHVENVTYEVRTYPDNSPVDDASSLIDVTVPAYQLKNTPMGDLTIGSYTVEGLNMPNGQDFYYRMYANDGLTMHFKAEQGGMVAMEDDYELTDRRHEMKVVISGKTIQIDNTFVPGRMPFPITTTFPDPEGASVTAVKSAKADRHAVYNMAGQRIGSGYKGLVVKNGRKHVQK